MSELKSVHGQPLFGSKDEANDELRKLRNGYYPFCPLTKETCNHDCVAYYCGDIVPHCEDRNQLFPISSARKGEAVAWGISEPGCACTMLVGEIGYCNYS